jgi:excisionase family DNA binding protein
MTIWNIKKAAEYLERSPGAIRNLVLRRKIPFRKVGGRLVFIEEEIRTWIEKAPGMTLDDCLKGDH